MVAVVPIVDGFIVVVGRYTMVTLSAVGTFHNVYASCDVKAVEIKVLSYKNEIIGSYNTHII